jgi:hypothetical protein
VATRQMQVSSRSAQRGSPSQQYRLLESKNEVAKATNLVKSPLCLRSCLRSLSRFSAGIPWCVESWSWGRGKLQELSL